LRNREHPVADSVAARQRVLSSVSQLITENGVPIRRRCGEVTNSLINWGQVTANSAGTTLAHLSREPKTEIWKFFNANHCPRCHAIIYKFVCRESEVKWFLPFFCSVACLIEFLKSTLTQHTNTHSRTDSLNSLSLTHSHSLTDDSLTHTHSLNTHSTHSHTHSLNSPQRWRMCEHGVHMWAWLHLANDANGAVESSRICTDVGARQFVRLCGQALLLEHVGRVLRSNVAASDDFPHRNVSHCRVLHQHVLLSAPRYSAGVRLV